MNILILYWKPRHSIVRTHDNHLYSFRRYGYGHHFYYFNYIPGRGIPAELTKIPFDAVLLHYTFLALRFDQKSFWKMYEEIRPTLQKLQGVKAIIPHDEYIYTKSLWAIIRDCNVQRIFSSCFYKDQEVIYPSSETGRGNICHPVFTGYIDPKTLRWVQKREKKMPRKDLDVVYRAGSANYVFGFHGQLKTRLAQAFHERLPRHPGLKEDVKLTYMDSYKNTITGNAWYEFLLRSRTALGCLGGASLLDPDGSLRQHTLTYIKEHPNATDEEIDRECYHGQEGLIQTRILGPRVFECAMTHTCQLMVEGDYFGVLEPNVHYIPIKEDFSNLDEVMDIVEKQPEYCTRIADQCYEHVVASGRYGYDRFVAEILEDLQSLIGTTGKDKYWSILMRFWWIKGYSSLILLMRKGWKKTAGLAYEFARRAWRKCRSVCRKLFCKKDEDARGEK